MDQLIFLSLIALVQGITECLPVSSSGHLEALMMGWQASDPLMACASSAGTLGAMLLYAGTMVTQGKLSFKEVIWSIKASALLYGVGGCMIMWQLNRPTLYGPLIMVSSVALWWADTQKGDKSLKELSWATALVWGAAECLAFYPGISRLGVSLTAGRLMGFSKEASVTFSFLLALPASAGHVAAGCLALVYHPDKWLPALYVSSLTAVISGCFLPLAWRLLINRSWMWIVIYRGLIGWRWW